MHIDFAALDYSFITKPLLVGGLAMEYYGLRKAGTDIDFVLAAADHANLVAKYPHNIKDLFGDIGVCVVNFELWNQIMLFDFGFLSQRAIEEENFQVISLEKLLFLKTLAIAVPKYEQDVRLIVKKIEAIQYGKDPDYGPRHLLG